MKNLFFFTFAIVMLAAFTADLMAHGGTWRGSRKPGYTNPPPAKYPDTPQGPKYPTPPSRPSTPSTPPSGPTTPPTGPSTPPTAPPTAPGTPVGPKGPGTAGPTNAGPGRPTGPAAPTSGNPGAGPQIPGGQKAPTAKPTAGKKAAASDTDANWDTWWEYNKHLYITVDKAAKKGNISGEEIKEAEKKNDEVIKNFLSVMKKEYNYDPRTSAAIALGKMSQKDNKDVYQVLVDGTEDQEMQVREASILALGLLGNKDAIGRLEKILAATDRKEVTERFFAAISLGLIGEEAVIPTLKDIVTKEKYDEVKIGALIAIGLFKKAEHVGYLVKVAKTEKFEDKVRGAAIQAISKIGTLEYIEKNKTINATKEFNEMVLDRKTDDVVKMSIINLYAEIKDKKSLEMVYKWYAKEKDNLARAFMVMAMAKIYPESDDVATKKQVFDLIVKEMEKGPYNVRGFAPLALGIMKDKKAYKILKDRFNDVKDPVIKASLAVALGLLGEKAAVPSLLETISSESKASDELQSYCALALGMLHKEDSTPDPQIADALVAALKDSKKKPNLMRQACIALALMNARDKGMAEMIAILEDEDTSIFEKGAAAQALGQFRDEAVVEQLWKKYSEEFAEGKQRHEFRAFLLIPIGMIKARESMSPIARLAENFNYTIAYRSITEMFDIL